VLRTLAQLVEYRREVSSSAAPVATAQVRGRQDIQCMGEYRRGGVHGPCVSRVLRTLAQLVEYRRGVSSSAAPVGNRVNPARVSSG